MNSHNITLDTYKTLTKIKWMEGDENFDGIMTEYNEELHYNAPPTEKSELITYLNKKGVKKRY